MRGFVTTIFVLVVLALAGLEVAASHSVRASEPLRNASAAPTWCWR